MYIYIHVYYIYIRTHTHTHTYTHTHTHTHMHRGCVVESCMLVNIRNKSKLLQTNLNFYKKKQSFMTTRCSTSAQVIKNKM